MRTARLPRAARASSNGRLPLAVDDPNGVSELGEVMRGVHDPLDSVEQGGIERLRERVGTRSRIGCRRPADHRDCLEAAPAQVREDAAADVAACPGDADNAPSPSAAVLAMR